MLRARIFNYCVLPSAEIPANHKICRNKDSLGRQTVSIPHADCVYLQRSEDQPSEIPEAEEEQCDKRIEELVRRIKQVSTPDHPQSP